MSRLAIMLIFVAGLLAGLGLSFARPIMAREGCLARYTVLAGDTLSEIAAQAGTSAEHLARINGIGNPHWIWAGQMLCMPQIETAARASFELVAEYRFNPGAEPDALNWTFGSDGIAAKRLSYPIAAGDSIKSYADPQDVRRIGATAPPMLWLIRRGATPDYILAVIGDPAPLLNLQLDSAPTSQISDIVPAPNPDQIARRACATAKQPPKKLSRTGQANVRLYAEIVTSEALSIPLPISQIDYHAALEQAVTCYSRVDLALSALPDVATSGYRLDLVLTDTSSGPPGDAWRSRCEQWQGNGWWTRLRRSLYGCPRR